MAEFLGTFILMFAQVCAIIMDEKHDGVLGLMGIAVSVGLAVMVLVFSLIHICGCHMNPAVSIAMAVYGHLPPAHIVPYIAAQVLGSTAASFVGNAIYHPGSRKIGTVPSVGTVEAFAVEFILTFVLLFVITAVAMDPHAVKELIAVAMAASVDGVWRQALTEYLEHRVPGWLKKLLGLSTDGRMEEEEEGEGDNEEEDEDEGEGAVAMELNLEQRLTLLLLLAILAAILAYHAMASPPLHNLVNYQRLAFSIVFITSLSIIAMLANRKLPAERGVRWHAMWVCVILDVVGLTCAFAATWGWGYWKISTIDVIVLPLAVLLCIAFHVALAITGTPKGLVQNLLSKLGLPPVLFAGGPDQSPQDDGTQHDYEFGMTGGTNEEPLGVEVASPILGGAFTLIVAVPVLSIVTIPVKLLVGIMIASIGVGLWQRLLARLLRALPSALQRLQGTTPPTGSSSPPQPVHGMCKLIHTMCSETWISIIISVMWVPSLRQNLKLKFKMSKIFSVLGVLADSAPTPNMTTATATTATAASTTTTAIVDTPSTTTSTVMGTPPITDLSNHDASSVTSMGREVQPLVEPRPRRNRRPNSRLIGSDWVN